MSWEISDSLYFRIMSILPESSTILELGSGEGTKRLVEHYKVYSIEHNEKYLNLYHDNYIYASIQPFRKQCGVFPDDDGWYDRTVLRKILPKISYDLILIDGPPAKYGRGGFYKWLDLFNIDVTMVFDDVHRARDMKLIKRVSAKVKRPFTVYSAWEPKNFGVIYAKG